MRVLDTDVCIEVLRGNAAVIARRANVADEVATTWVTAAELYYGAARSIAPDENRQTVAVFLRTLPVLGIGRASAERFGQLKRDLREDGNLIPDADLLIGSIALAVEATLVTGNTKHMERIPSLELENWIR